MRESAVLLHELFGEGPDRTLEGLADGHDGLALGVFELHRLGEVFGDNLKGLLGPGLEPVNCAAIDERWKLPEPRPR